MRKQDAEIRPETVFKSLFRVQGKVLGNPSFSHKPHKFENFECNVFQEKRKNG